MCCRRWTSRAVFDVDDHFNPYYQYTDTGNGTYWCTARVELSSEGAHSVSVGVRFDDTKWFAIVRGGCVDAGSGREAPGYGADLSGSCRR